MSLYLAESQPQQYTPVLVLRPAVVYRLASERWTVRVPADQLCRLASGPNAARELRSRRHHLGPTPQNQALAEMLRTRPGDFGSAGDPIVLGAEQIQYDGHRLTLFGVECIDGFQRLHELASAAQELSADHIAPAMVALEVVLGDERSRVRILSDQARLFVNPHDAQDNLVRCPRLAAIKEEYEHGGGPSFDVRRGIEAGPHCAGYSVVDVFRALAAASSSLHMAHAVSTIDGLTRLWSDIEGPAYRSLIGADVRACGIQRVLEARRTVLQTLGSVRKPVRSHAHIVTHAPELFVWTTFRWLPLARLHDDGRDVPHWSEIFEDLPDVTRRVGNGIIERYQNLRPGRTRDFRGDVARVETWRELVGELECV